MSRKIPSVVIFTDFIPQDLREMFLGVTRFVQEHGRWNVYNVENKRWPWSNRLRSWEDWRPDGIIAASVHTVEEARRIRALGVPTVVLLQPPEMRQPDYPLAPMSCCVWNSPAIGEMAARYFVERSYRHFAFVDAPWADSYWSQEREEGFHGELMRTVGATATYARYGACTKREQADWMAERPRLARWLRGLPKPCAVFAPNDRRGKQILDACRLERIPVPGEIAVLGVDDDAWICESSIPALSSIRCAPEQAGYAVAAHLDALMRGVPLSRKEFSVEPLDVVTRQSTDWTAVQDDVVAHILRLIQERAAEHQLSVDSLARASGVARRTLEVRFRNATGKSIREEIEHVRLSRVKTLLKENRLSLAEIARQTGFASLTHLERIFRNRHGVTPTASRRIILGREAP
ncbi:MAG: XylR family transcriptional regulator [bacterium]|nr:XylR family transcriptional regulator [bacterium]